MKKKYGDDWKRIRNEYAKAHPKCEMCGAKAEEIHHRKPLSEGGTHDVDNLMALCCDCHSELHRWMKKEYRHDGTNRRARLWRLT